MKTINILRLSAFGAGSLAAPAAIAGLIVSAPVDVVGNLPIATFIGDNFATLEIQGLGQRALCCRKSNKPRRHRRIELRL